MAKAKLVIKHNLHELSKEDLQQYLQDVSTFIGLDPDLNGLDTIWMDNESGQGRALVVYARRGTAEILRNLYGVEVESLTYATVSGSIVFTATGRAKARENRQEIAVGSKYVNGLTGKTLDDSIMTASTRALRRLTMQFTTLGILDESEVVGVVGQTPNQAGSAQLATNSLPPVFLPPPVVPANNAPGKPVEAKPAEIAPPAAPELRGEQFLGRPEQVAEVWKQHEDAEADKKADTATPAPAISPLESTTTITAVADISADKPKRRKKANTVALDVEPETVSSKPPVSAAVETPAKVETAPEPPRAAPAQAAPPPPEAVPALLVASTVGMPTEAQMAEYRKKISVYTVQLPPSQDLGPTQKMRAFITKVSGSAPQNMTVDQWDDLFAFIDGFMERNQGNVKNLVKYINDMLGVK